MAISPNPQAVNNWSHEALLLLLRKNMIILFLGNHFFLILITNMKDKDSIFNLGPFYGF